MQTLKKHNENLTIRDKVNHKIVSDQDIFSKRNSLAHDYKTIRALTEKLCSPLVTEDFVIQSMPDVSPTKWHLAHTSWFFETFVLKKATKTYKDFNPMYNYLFNSYYVQIGPRFQRSQRGLLSRPGVKEVYDYRNFVNKHMMTLFDTISNEEFQLILPVIGLGLHHEQQHQELILTDIKHVFSLNPLYPVYMKREDGKSNSSELDWVNFEGGIYHIGHDEGGFSFDNETPRHKEYIEPFQLASRLVTNEEYYEFIRAGGYEKPELWLSDGWAAVSSGNWKAPLYWYNDKDSLELFTLNGLKKLNPDEPVCHISFYEADAFARWKGMRLPTESEWEVASSGYPVTGNFLEGGSYHPLPAASEKEHHHEGSSLKQMFGDLWEWTRSSYSPYPGFKTSQGAIGEYNGKFMSGQMVLRGGSCLTPQEHIRNTYRNFFPPNARWQFSGIRLAKDLK